MDLTALQRRYEEARQGHVFEHYDSLSEDEKKAFQEQLSSIEIEKIRPLLASAMAAQSLATGDIAPFSKGVGRSSDAALVASSEKVGMEAIRNGQVAALVLSGGQGTRLGFDGPKGMYNIGMPSNKSLFQLFGPPLRL